MSKKKLLIEINITDPKRVAVKKVNEFAYTNLPGSGYLRFEIEFNEDAVIEFDKGDVRPLDADSLEEYINRYNWPSGAALTYLQEKSIITYRTVE